MTHYTPAQRTEALQTIRTHGYAETHRQTGISVTTLQKWARQAKVTPHDGRKTIRANAESTAGDQRAVADAEKASRQAKAQAALGDVATQQVTLVSAHQQVSAKIVARVMRALNALDAADAAVASGSGSREQQREAARVVDAELGRARTASISFGVHVDKLLRLAGEDAVAGAQGGAHSSSSVVTVLLTEDAEFRRQVAASVGERYRAIEAKSSLSVVNGEVW